MTAYNVRGFIHVYTGLFRDVISFGDSREGAHVGHALIEFVYSDLKAAAQNAHQPEALNCIHPYFRFSSTEWKADFLQHAADEESLPYLYTWKQLENLQQRYLQMLHDLCCQSGDISLENRIHEQAELKKCSLFSRVEMRTHLLDGQETAVCDYFVNEFEECLFLEMMELLRRHIVLKVCKNCSRLFIPKRTNIDYCQRIFTTDGKTCAEVGYTQTFAKTVKNDELLQAYTRAYKAHYARMTKPRKKTPNMTRESFEQWYAEAKQRLDAARNGTMDAEDFRQWLKK